MGSHSVVDEVGWAVDQPAGRSCPVPVFGAGLEGSGSDSVGVRLSHAAEGLPLLPAGQMCATGSGTGAF